MGWPGIGIASVWPVASYDGQRSTPVATCCLWPLTTPGNIRLREAAAASAFGFPPSKQSSNSNRGWRTGFENETFPESTSVIFRTPQACDYRSAVPLDRYVCIYHEAFTSSARATKHPSVPAPSRRHLVPATVSKFRAGKILHRISLRLRSIACSARLPIDQQESKRRAVVRGLTALDPSSERGLRGGVRACLPCFVPSRAPLVEQQPAQSQRPA